jgi:hypothetical protein
MEKMEKFNPNRSLITFLHKLAENLEKNKLTDEEIQKVGEFYIAWVSNKQEEEDMTDKDFMKFFTMGWYVYKQILKGDTI